jgi:histone deacetylase 11
MPRIFYTPHYNFGGFGAEKLHPFDGSKFGKVWHAVLQEVPGAADLLVQPTEPVSRATMERVHDAEYLKQLGTSHYLSKVFEVPLVKFVHISMLERVVLAPMRWAAQGTLLAAREALAQGAAINLGGGYHHAKPASGEGFNVYNDVAIAIAELRAGGELSPQDRILYIDADAHQANGICHCFMQDRSVRIFDIHNAQVYPRHDRPARERIDHGIRLPIGCDGESYLLQLQRALPGWLEEMTADRAPALAIYNAGTDVAAGDMLGGLSLQPQHILERDLWVLHTLRRRGVPTVMVLGGGYTAESWRLVANTVVAWLKKPQ